MYIKRSRIDQEYLIKGVPLFSKLTHLESISRKTVIAAAIAITAVITVSYLATRQMFPYDNFSGAIIFGLTIVTGAIGSFIILKYVVKQARIYERDPYFLTECSRS